MRSQHPRRKSYQKNVYESKYQLVRRRGVETLTCPRLFETGHFADFTIKFHGMEMKVHKSVLDARLPFFKNLKEEDIQV